MDQGVFQLFENEKAVKNFLKKLEESKFLIGYYISGNYRKAIIQAFVLLLYTGSGFKENVLDLPEIRCKIRNLYLLNYSSENAVLDEFYNDAKFLIIAEFLSIEDYHQWKNLLYTRASDQRRRVNVMTFIVEDCLSEHKLNKNDG